MKKSVKGVLVAIAVIACAVLTLKGSVLIVQSGSWSQTGNLSSARVGASAALLPDGRILVTGGDPRTGPVATADFFGTDGTISAAPPMINARSQHVSVTMQDGRVLVAGGLTVGGGATNTAEIFDPVQNSWTAVGVAMIEARSGATAAVLQDGRVAIAGGQNGTAISSTIETFNPALGTFTSAGMMSSPRTQHAMALLQSGQVLIVGGNSGNTGTPPAPTPVASTDIFDPVAGTVSAGPSLATARYNHSATTLFNGQVVVIGGNNGNTNPAQMDVTPAELVDFTAATPAFTTLATNLATQREGHLAFLLPNNNNVLIVGGSSAGTTIASAELFSPQETPQDVWTYAFGSTGSMIAARSSATGSANQVNAPTTIMQRNGVLMVAGGNDANGNALNTTEAYGYPTVQTDQSDYPPFTTVTITGSGFQPGETVTLSLVESPLIDTGSPFTTVADANGNFSDNSFVTNQFDINVRFYLTATGQTSGFQAQNTFADNKTLDITFAGNGAGSVAVSDTTTPTDSTTCSGSPNPCDVTTANSDVGTLTATASSGSAFAGWSAQSAGVTGCSGNTCSFSMNNTGQSVTATFKLHQLAITSVNGGTNPTAGTPFSVVVQSQDGNGNPLNVVANTGVTLSLNTGTGTLGGTLTGTITAGSNTVTISGVTYTKAQSGVVLTATRTSGDTLAPGNSAAFTVNPGAASTLVFTTQPGGGTAGTAWTVQPVVTLEDANGNTVTGTAQTVTLAIQNNSGGGTLSGTTAAAVNTSTGVATFSGLSINKVGTGYTLTATGSTVDTTAGTVISSGFNITAGTATQLVFGTQPSNTQAGSSITPAVTVEVEDANGNVVTSSTVSIAMAIGTNPGGGTLSGTTPVSAVNGVATFSNLSINKVGTGYTLAASSTGLSSATSSVFNITPGTATKVVFNQQPTNTTAGASISPAVTVQVEDADNNVVTTSTASIVMATGTNPGSGTLSGTTPVSAVNGVATFSNLSINKTGTGYTLAASSSGLTGATSSTFNIAPGTATQLVFGTQPSNTAAGSSITPAVTVQVEDANNNVVTTSTASIAVAIGTNPGGGTLSGTTPVSAVNGVATFSNLSINKTGTGYTLAASSTGVAGATSNTFNITAGPVSAGTSTVTANPTSVTADGTTTSTITVTLLDANSNPVSGKTVTLTAGSGSSTITTVNGTSNASGQATFTVKDTKAETVTYTAKDTTDTITITQTATVTFTDGAATKLAFGQQPTNTGAGSSITPAVTVQVEDANGNVVTSGTGSNASITIAIGTNPSSGTLTGTLTQTAVNGVATFSNLSINKTGTGYTLTAGNTGLTGATSNTFNITPGAASQLVFGTQPSNTEAGSSITPAVTVQVEDANNNVVTTSAAAVAIAIGTNPAGGTLSGTTSVNAVNGVATFNNLSINKTGTGYTLAASSTGLTGVTSNAFNVTPGTASKVVFSQQPTNTQAGSSITPAVTVQVEDANNNVVTTSTASITVAIGTNPAGGTLSGTTSVSAVNGVAIFSNLSINKTGTGYTLAASSTGLTGATSNTFNITPGAASKLAFNVQPSTTAAGQAISPAVTVQVQDANGNVVTTDSSSVSITISSPGAFSGTSTTTVSASSGVATFSNLIPTVAGTTFTLSASDGSLTSATSNSFTVSAGALAKFVFGMIGAQTVGTPFSVILTAEDANGNTVTSYSGDGDQATLTLSSGTLVGSPVSVMFSNGVGTQSVTITTAGSFTLTATGNPGHASGIIGTSNTFTVNQASTSTTLTSSANPSVFGQSVTFTATVTDSSSGSTGTPTGTVTFKDGTTTLGTGTLNGSGVATFSTSSLSVASHSITAVYGGDTNFTGSASSILSQVVSQATTTTAASASPNSITFGQSTTVTVTVSPQFGGTPSGTVSVSDGLGKTGDTCNIILSGGTGQCSLTPSANGNLTVTATYGADPNFKGSSGTASLTVTGTPPSITSAASTTFTAGTPGSFMVTTTGTPTPSLSDGSATLPSGVSFHDNGNGTATLSGTTTAAGTYQFTITAQNGVTPNATQSFALTVVAGTITHLALTPASASITAGGSQAYAAQGLDAFNNPAGDVTSATIFSIAPDGSCGTPSPGNNTCTTTVADVNGSSHTVTGTYLNGATGSASLTVTAASPTQLKITSNAFTIIAGQCSGNITVTSEDQYGNTSNVSSAMQVDLSSASTTGKFYSDAACQTLIPVIPANTAKTSVSIASGSSSQTFAYTDTTISPASSSPAFTTAITAADHAAVLNSGTQNETILQLMFTTASFTTTQSTCSGPITLTVENANGTPTSVTVAAALGLTSTSGGATFYSDTGCSTALTPSGTPLASDVTVASGASAVSFSYEDSAAGNPTITATIGGYSVFQQEQIGTPPQITSASSTTFTVTTLGTFTVTTTGSPTPSLIDGGAGLPSGITFHDNGNGTATLSGTPALGTVGTYNFTITASNGVNPNATQSFTLTVQPLAVKVTVSSATVTYNGASQTVSVTSSVPSVVVTTYTSTSPAYNSTTGPTNAGTYIVTATLTDTADYKFTTDSTTTGTLTIDPATPLVMVTGGPFKYDGNPHPAVVTATGVNNYMVPGTFVVMYSPLGNTTTPVNAGTYSVSATFMSSDPNYTGSVGAGSIMINPAATTTSTSSSSPMNTSTYGDMVTFTAVVTNTSTGAAPTGTLTVTIDGSMESATVMSSGNTLTATYSTSTLMVSGSPHTVTATYINTDNNFSSSPAATVMQTVNQANSATALTASPASVTLGDTVTLTATVTDNSGGSMGTPTGLVVFFDGGTPIGTGMLSGGVGTFTTSLLAVASHSITAAYEGDTNFKSSTTSSATTETVALRSSATMVALNPATVVVGQQSAVTATVTDSGTNPQGTADTWISTGNPTIGTTGSTATLFADGMVLVAGGMNSGAAVQNAYIYNATSKMFTATTGSLKYARTGATATLLPNGEILIAGGSSDGTAANALNTAELYNPVAGTFTVAGSGSGSVTTAARFGQTATLLTNGQVLIAGGENGSGPTVLASAELYNPTTDSFTATGTLGTGRYGAAGALLASGKVLLVGGTGSSGALTSAELFDPTGNSNAGAFSPTGSLGTARTGATTTVLLNGNVLIAGGSSDASTPLNTAEIYDPNAAMFTPSNSTLSAARFNGTATLLPNGMVLLIGGTTGQTAELYDADSDKFDATGGLMNADQASLTATLLNKGHVLVTGLTSGGSPDAELYTPSFNPLGTVALTSSEVTDSFARAACVLMPSSATASTCASSVTPSNVATSPHTITGSYPTDTFVHSGSSNTASFTVNKADTLTTITSSPSPSIYGGQVTFSAAVTVVAPGAGSPSGTVQFMVDGSNYGSPVALTSGSASIPVSALTAGTHSITAVYSGDSNFNGTGSGNSTATGVTQTVQKATPVFSSLTASQTITYGTPSISLAGSISAPCGTGCTVYPPTTETVSITINGVTVTPAIGSNGYFSATFNTSTIPASATAYTTTFSYNTNYADTNFKHATDASTTLTVNTRPITATLMAQNKTYDGTNAESNANMSCSLTGVLSGDTANVTCTPSSGTFNSSQVASATTVTATVTINGTAASNYALGAAGTSTTSTSATATAHITTAAVTATLTAANKTYDGTTTEPNAMSCSVAPVVTGDMVNCAATSGTFNSSQVATATAVTATVTISGTAASNYTLGAAGTSTTSTSATATAHITTAAVTATLTAANKTYDGTTTEPNAMSCSLTGVLSGDTANVTCTATGGTFNTSQVATANLVTATVTISGTSASDYTVGATGTTISSTSATTTAHITAAAASVTPAAASKTYGAADPAFTGTLTGFLVADGVTATYTRTAGQTVTGSPYTISATLSPTSVLGNYNITYNTANFTITPASLTITASSSPMIYGGPVPPITASYSGFVNGDTAASLTTQPNCVTSATSSSPVSGNPYASACSGAVGSNYTISYSTGVVTVMQATTTITVSSSVNPSTFMQLVTFTATVTPQYSGTPTGIVTFQDTYNGSTITLGTFTLTTLSGGVATFSTTTLQDKYSNSIMAVYAGDGNFTGSNNTTSPLVQTVNPAPNVSLNPGSVSFGNLNVGQNSSIGVTLTNIGDAALTVNSIMSSDTTDFSQSNNCPNSLGYTAPNNYCTITVTFKPADTGVIDAVLTITDNDDGATGTQDTVSLTGAGLSTITGGSLYTDAIFAAANGCGSITMSGNGSVDSFNSSAQGGYSSSHVLSGGNVGTDGNVSLSGNSTIYGSAAVDYSTTGNCTKTSMTGVSTSGGAKVTGGLVALKGPITYPAPPAPNPAPPTTNENVSHSCPSGMTGCTNGANNSVTLAPGSYGNVQFSGGTTAYVSEGVYNFNSLVLSGNSILYVNSGPVVINLAGAALSGGNPAMDLSGGSIVNPTGIPANLQFLYAGSQGVNLSGGAESYATVYAPNALVNMSGNSDFFGSIIGSTLTDSGNAAIHYDTSLPSIKAGNYIWFNAVVNNVKNLGSGQVKLYLTDSTISFTANGTNYSVPVPNAVVTFNSASQTSGAKATYDLTNNRWSTAVAPSGLTGNTFVTGVAFQVPTGGFPTGIQNVTWSAAFTTDTTGVNLLWQWGAAVYNTSINACYAYQNTSSSSTCYNSTSNTNVFGVNAEDGSADMYGTDPASTPETYKQYVVFGAAGGGGANYIGYLSSGAGVVPTIAPISVSPSSLNFGTQNQGTTSAAMTAVVTNNDSMNYNFTVPSGQTSPVYIGGANPSDFALLPNSLNTPNNCVGMTSLASGASCTLYATFTPNESGAVTAKIVVNDGANNSPQTVYLSGAGH